MNSVEFPVTFEYKGKTYKGSFDDALRPSNDVWFLMVDNYY
jgi:hypothetical protein